MDTTVTIRMQGVMVVRLEGGGPSPELQWQLEELAKKNGLTLIRVDVAMTP